jgi:predicted nucleic acid-binding protein
VYLFDRREPDRSRRIREWLRQIANDHQVVLSTQVLIEFRSVLTRKLRPSLSEQDVHSALAALEGFEVTSTNASLVLDAHQLAISEQLSWFDALIVEAAIRSKCNQLFSEDIGHERKYAGLIVLNPFLM